MNKDKTCFTFLFGAGADSQYGLKTGDEFSSALLTDAYSNERKTLLGKEYAKYRLVHHNSKKVFLQTIAEYPKEAIQSLGKDIVEKCLQYGRKKLWFSNV